MASLFNCAPALAESTAPLLQKSDLVYQGAFRVPAGSSQTDTFAYGGTALGYNPTNNSLFITGHDWEQKTAEISIPNIVNSTNIGSLAIATMLQSFRDATEGELSSINPSDLNPQKIGGHLVFGDKLYISGFSYYDGGGTQNTSHFVRPLSLSTAGQVQGPYQVGSNAHYTSGYMTLIPPEWQSAFGGPALTGNCCLSITSTQSNGPAVSVFDPSHIGQTNPVPAIQLVGYPYPSDLGPGRSTQNAYFNLTTRVTGVVFPYGTRSVLFVGRHGTGNYCYGEGAQCSDPADSSKGNHAYPYVYQVWAYDANDLVAVKNGSRSEQLEPYAMWTFDLPFEDNGIHWIGGAAYDSNTGRIFLSQLRTGGDNLPVIHVFRGERAASAPRAPTNLQSQ